MDNSEIAFPQNEIRRKGPVTLLRVCWQQWRAERALARRGIQFRSANAESVAAAYSRMTPEEFAAINGRQEWANWRTIPRALRHHMPFRPLVVLDLGCGTGGSTCVLAFYCPHGSRILGYEVAEPLVAIARRRRYLQCDGNPAAVQFRCQQITETLRQVNGRPWPDHSVDIVNASGIIGHHFRPTTISPLLAELQRVLVPGGLAMLDVGPTLARKPLAQLMAAAGFRRLGHYRSWFGDPTGQSVFQNGGKDAL